MFVGFVRRARSIVRLVHVRAGHRRGHWGLCASSLKSSGGSREQGGLGHRGERETQRNHPVRRGRAIAPFEPRGQDMERRARVLQPPILLLSHRWLERRAAAATG